MKKVFPKIIAGTLLFSQVFFPFFAYADEDIGAGGAAAGGAAAAVACFVGRKLISAAGAASTLAGKKDFIFVPAFEANPFVVGSTAATAGHTGELSFKDCILDAIARVATVTVIRALTNTVIGWIQGGGGGLVENLEQELRLAGDAAGGEILNEIAGINLCGDLNAFLNFTLRSPRSALRARLECTVTDIIRNVENHYRDFSEGGWPAFIELSIQPGNSPVGAYLISLDSKIAAENRQRETTLAKYIAGSGFLGLTDEVEICEPVRDRQGRIVQTGGRGQNTCRIERKIKFPGRQVADTLSKSLNIDLDIAVVGDELNESIIAIANALLTKLISSSYSVSRSGQLGARTSAGPGLFSSELSSIPPPNVQETVGGSVREITDNDLLRVHELVRAVDTEILSTRQKIIAARKEDPPAPTETLQSTLAQRRGQKQSLLDLQLDLLLLKESIENARTTDTLTSRAGQARAASERIDGIAQSLNVFSFTERASGDRVDDALRILSGTRQNLNNQVSAVNLAILELNRMASSTAATSTARLRDIAAKKREAQAQLTLLTASLGRTAELENDLSFATEERVIDGLIRDITDAIITANQTIEQVERVLSRDIDPFLGIRPPDAQSGGGGDSSSSPPSGGIQGQQQSGEGESGG